jgi:hypothetical protein
MEMTLSEATQLVGQVQIAHRLSVGFYQRLLPLLTHIASELECMFWYWEPCHNDRPCQASTSPANKWAWDFMPLFAARYAYLNAEGDSAQSGDIAVFFTVHIDANYKPESRKRLGSKGQPDPVSLPIGEAEVEIILYRCDGENGDSFQRKFDLSPWPKRENEGWEDVGQQMSACLLTRKLTDFIAEPETIIADLRAILTADHTGMV